VEFDGATFPTAPARAVVSHGDLGPSVLVTAVPGEPELPPPSGAYLSLFPVATYRERLEGLMDAAWQGVEQQAPEALEKMAVTARNIAERLDELATEARQRVKEREGASDAAGTSERGPEPERPPPSPGGTAGP
jgi:hypothetical protein